MSFNVGDRIIYQDEYLNFFKGEIVDIWKDDNDEISAYFVATTSGLHIHFKPSSLDWCRIEESACGSLELASGMMELQ